VGCGDIFNLELSASSESADNGALGRAGSRLAGVMRHTHSTFYRRVRRDSRARVVSRESTERESRERGAIRNSGTYNTLDNHDRKAKPRRSVTCACHMPHTKTNRYSRTHTDGTSLCQRESSCADYSCTRKP